MDDGTGLVFLFFGGIFGFYATQYAISGESGRPVPTWIRVVGASFFPLTIPVAVIRWVVERPDRAAAIRTLILTVFTVLTLLQLQDCTGKIAGWFD